MLRSKKAKPVVDGLESRLVMASGLAAPAAMIGPLAAIATKVTGTIPLTAGVHYDPATGLNLITAYGHGTVGTFGRNTWVTIEVAQATAANGSVVEFGAMFIFSRYGLSVATLTDTAAAPVLTPGSFTLPSTFTFGINAGPGAANHTGGTAQVYSGTKGLQLSFG